MTALQQYRRLEALGLWRENAADQRREVVVSLGDATLVVSTAHETALTHWSLAAVERLNPGRIPALYSPGADSTERLEIEDPDMIEALEKVLAAIRRSGPHPGRLRWLLGAGFGLGALALAVFWLPEALTRQTVALLPEAKRAEIGGALLDEMTRLAGQPCTAPRGLGALRDLTGRVFPGPNAPEVVVLPATIPDTIALPGNLIVISAALVEDHETPEVLAGYLLAEEARRRAVDPIHALLTEAGLTVTFRLLTTGLIATEPLAEYAMTLLSRPEAPVPAAKLIALFDEARISTQPYAFARDVSGETVLPLIEADPLRNADRAPLLSDQSWVSLQEICTRS
ncbi:hypothetical protein roselon_03630 [Roseibacterium elongatum DSM 19469]|uniref:Uncharacterized protein n=1 Tax=Roseicyclus elongatus DSM 19469 TaxID=1294273 RepID=W8RXD8_9RHOB|nr:hypothetical protein [Roseibacterium elongatum]AHM05874.1 hypothetical protein roselon_03630 [Roseibacterium elongatum DSM 19469]